MEDINDFVKKFDCKLTVLDVLRREANNIADNPKTVFPAKVLSIIGDYYKDINMKEKRICVPYSGNNLIAYAFDQLYANVTSIDISGERINYIKAILKNIEEQKSKENKDYKENKIEFLPKECEKIDESFSNEFDLVFTTEASIYLMTDYNLILKNFNKILKKEGKYILFDSYPVGDKNVALRAEYWNIDNFKNSLTLSGFEIKHTEEIYYDEVDAYFHCLKCNCQSESFKENYLKSLKKHKDNPLFYALCAEKIN